MLGCSVGVLFCKSGTHTERCNIVFIRVGMYLKPRVLNGEDLNNINGILKKIEAVSELQLR